MDTKKILNILENALHISVNGKVILDKKDKRSDTDEDKNNYRNS